MLSPTETENRAKPNVTPDLIVAEDLDVRLGGRNILQGLHFVLPAGGRIGLLGPNGSGKTTLMRALSGLIPYTGSLRLSGREVRAWRPRELARRMAFVRQSASFSFEFTVREFVLLGRSPHKDLLGGYTRDDDATVDAALDRLDILRFADRSVTSLSGGELQRVLLAQALTQQADVLLLDEPMAHLDVHHQYALMREVDALVTEGKSVITVFHDLQMAVRFSDLVLIVFDGRLVACGKPDQVVDERLVADVFQMNVSIDLAASGGVRIDYLSPIQSPTKDQ